MVKTTFINATIGDATMELQDLLNEGFEIILSKIFRENNRTYLTAVLAKEEF